MRQIFAQIKSNVRTTSGEAPESTERERTTRFGPLSARGGNLAGPMYTIDADKVDCVKGRNGMQSNRAARVLVGVSTERSLPLNCCRAATNRRGADQPRVDNGLYPGVDRLLIHSPAVITRDSKMLCAS